MPRRLIYVLSAAIMMTATASFAADADTTCQLTIELADAETGKPVAGVVRLRDADGKVLTLAELTARGIGVSGKLAIHQWSLLPKATTISAPRGKVDIEAFQGLETEIGNVTLDLSDRTEASVRIPLKRFLNARKRGLQSGNTHIHLQKIGRDASEQYLLEVAAAEQLDLLYISYLERAVADLEYTTNKYTLDDLKRLTRASHKLQAHWHEFDNGEEHRHNFTGFGEGYGHVMFLHLPELVRPVSIGPGIMKKGFDYPPLKPGIENALEQNAAVIWCHNRFGMEDVPNWLAGNLHANNIFDGGTRGSFRHSFYRYLNAGLKVPFSTGTDWFIYDFNRVYIHGSPEEISEQNRLSSAQWLAALRAGRSTITNGPILDFRVGDGRPGSELKTKRGDRLHIQGNAVGRVDFKRLQLVKNGKVICTTPAKPAKSGGHFRSTLEFELTVDEPCWLALRTPPPSSTFRDPDLQRKTPLNEYGRELFSHSSAVHVDVDGRRLAQPEAVKDLIAEVEQSLDVIEKAGKFASPADKAKVMQVYRDAVKSLQERLSNRQ